MNGPSSICQVQTSRPCEKDVTSSPATRKVHEIAGVPLGCSATACHSCIMWQDGSGVRSIMAYWILLAYWPKANVDHINCIPKISQIISLLFHCGHQCTRLLGAWTVSRDPPKLERRRQKALWCTQWDIWQGDIKSWLERHMGHHIGQYGHMK